ncbi:MAG: putative ABC transporter ATP-binding protein YbhF [Lentisphaerae bacterium ADurb.Bin242]|nr:MAG: putative ABC transporter ATP-binding protein YbhF [Lentisphaerae bacterium ADurb.Bin242]
MNTVECRGLSKIFPDGKDSIQALSDITFTLPSGKIVGLLGPDAAGKTTLLRLLCGLMKPTSGSASVLGFDTVKQAGEIQKRIGYMPQKFGLYENLSVEENMRLYADLHEVRQEIQPERFAKLLEMTMLSPFRTRMAGALSGGMKQKLALICALVSEPELMILDEPTVGVDVLSRRELWIILRQIVNEGRMTVIASTAYLDEADYCDRTLILFEGKLLADAPPAEILAKASKYVEKPTFENGFQILLSGSVPPRLERKHPVRADAPVLIHAEKIIKKFGSFTAVDQVSFDVRKGEIFGLLGANGAGKTTTFRMLCGLSASDGGVIEIAGVNLRHAPSKARCRIGFMAQKFSLYSDITVRQNLEFFGGAYGLYGDKLGERVEWAFDRFSLRNFADSNTGKLPLGYKQRLSMACALLHEPEILFLDEATSGADPMARREFWQRIMELADNGVAVIITTHFLDEATYCDRMAIMQDGVITASGSVEEIIRQGTLPDGETPSLEDAFVNIIRNFRREHEHA